MKRIAVFALFASAALADVVPETTLTSASGLMVSARIPEGDGLVVFVRSALPETDSFRVTAEVVLANGRVVALRKSIARTPDSIPGTFWTVANIETGKVARIVSLTVREQRAPATFR